MAKANSTVSGCINVIFHPGQIISCAIRGSAMVTVRFRDRVKVKERK